MALNHNILHTDPALSKYSSLWVNRHQYFRWTPRTAWLTFAYVIMVPGIFGYMGYVTDGKYEMRGKRRGDIISEW
ncbi:hypothetical protein EV356DRAFT_506224 [Viridothelium virens]|uniref:NADH dehydrogenase [ubiquinone] 1 beta subcomplex subunit 4 n=1 Tax=Viridothelium virens TaxID=1048519 RepID=A0A6A6H2B3_VIRVR|nr:hypothetical protein EV356DRAFT_506224 [Viridothelium virens]